ncbi:MAG: dihydrolipoyl dehydrogenase [Candidatus Loosdrechtia sp.]|uniref:dihydrolipoyl dehydrogenase family protein n=1 Tax=Candidatus Loosdrechtia sp. TaxID=3101272 RepID=UPI003A65167A|nr:MAG: dihydrolipoyl dehydrogenase [Candidatus Jettenia sp. AMX2]
MPERSFVYDLAIIGAGPGGYVAAIKAAQSGIKTALIEKGMVGGVCLHWGCIPTKTLLYSAGIYDKLKKARDYGIVIDTLNVDYSQFHRRKESVVSRLYQGVQFLLKKNGVEVIEGEGQLISPNEILIKKNGTDIGNIRAKNVILATGSSPFVPKGIPHNRKNVFTSDDILIHEEIPKSIIIAGGGAVGSEYAYLFNVLGTKVKIVELMDTILPAEDKEISTTLGKIFTRRGIDILVGTSLEDVEINDKGVRAKIKRKDTLSSPPPSITEDTDYLEADYLLLALGRIPTLEHLGIENVSLGLKGKYVQVNNNMETFQKGIFAIGDIAGPPLLAHKALNEGLAAVAHISGKGVPAIQYQNIPRVTYCLPQVASIGLTSEEAENKGLRVKVGKFPLAANSKAVIEGEYQDGFIKIITDEKYHEILGVHAIGSNVSELLWGISLATILEGTSIELTRCIFPHPTLSEALLEAAQAATDKSIHL